MRLAGLVIPLRSDDLGGPILIAETPNLARPTVNGVRFGLWRALSDGHTRTGPAFQELLLKCLAPVGTRDRDFHLSIVVRQDEPIGRAALGVPFFVEVMSLVYRAEGTEPQQLDRDAKQRASSAFSVLNSWRVVPGLDGDGRIDGTRLQGWMEEAERLLRQAERAAVGHQKIGQMLSECPHDADGTWPCKAVRDVIEKVESKDLEMSLGTGLVNSRGVLTKHPSEGGASERALAERYEGYAAAVRATHPRTAGALRRIGQSHRENGSREDFRVEMWEEL